jgi:hypothetical protein
LSKESLLTGAQSESAHLLSDQSASYSRRVLSASACGSDTAGTPTRFPFHTGSAKKLTFGQSPIITVIEKAFWDVGHAPKDQGNRRKYMPGYAVWEIHPVMKIDVQ